MMEIMCDIVWRLSVDHGDIHIYIYNVVGYYGDIMVIRMVDKWVRFSKHKHRKSKTNKAVVLAVVSLGVARPTGIGLNPAMQIWVPSIQFWMPKCDRPGLPRVTMTCMIRVTCPRDWIIHNMGKLVGITPRWFVFRSDSIGTKPASQVESTVVSKDHILLFHLQDSIHLEFLNDQLPILVDFICAAEEHRWYTPWQFDVVTGITR